MSFAHLTLPTRDVEATARFFGDTFGFPRGAVPDNSPVDAQWLDIGRGQTLHVIRVDGFAVSPFEHEFGRHVAVFHPLDDFGRLREALVSAGAELIAPLRATPFQRFFFREPVNGYVFEVIESGGRE